MPRTFNPVKLLQRLRLSLQKKALRRRYGQEWEEGEKRFLKRSYKSYDEYITHQQSKLELHQFGEYDAKFRDALQQRLRETGIAWNGKTVLCLAARLGTEVKAFLDVGCFAVGIDLNPGKQNAYVLYGDFHALQFASHSVDCVFTNSLDHAFDLERLAREIARVLKPDGLLMIEALQGRREGAQPGFFESFWWDSIDELIAKFAATGFELKERSAISYPWPGEALQFRPPPRHVRVFNSPRRDRSAASVAVHN